MNFFWEIVLLTSQNSESVMNTFLGVGTADLVPAEFLIFHLLIPFLINAQV